TRPSTSWSAAKARKRWSSWRGVLAEVAEVLFRTRFEAPGTLANIPGSPAEPLSRGSRASIARRTSLHVEVPRSTERGVQVRERRGTVGRPNDRPAAGPERQEEAAVRHPVDAQGREARSPADRG